MNIPGRSSDEVRVEREGFLAILTYFGPCKNPIPMYLEEGDPVGVIVVRFGGHQFYYQGGKQHPGLNLRNSEAGVVLQIITDLRKRGIEPDRQVVKELSRELHRPFTTEGSSPQGSFAFA